MTRISLRAYHLEIEDQVENHQYDQAISHCRHILKYYPKNINTYRLLGKAYLESHRYADATDIFQRVLSSVPDDFVSHVGNSIIREDEGNLDEAIWHMERAFESQPANGAIQSELRRLHGRREGVEPPKIRLTRGALARMYLKGELFQQAIAELRAGLHEDPKRYDLQVLLAQAYFASGQRVDAAEACSKIIKGLPFCLEANRILADILSNSERAAEAKVYLSRVQSLDPYTAHISPAAPTADKVPDAAVLLEKLDWRPGISLTEKSSQPEWASTIGVDLGETTSGSETIPEWLATPAGAGHMQTTTPEITPQGASQPAEPVLPSEDVPIPEWMREAGWVSSSGKVEENISLPVDESKDLSEELAPAEIPEWLKSIAPEDQKSELTGTDKNIENEISKSEDLADSSVPWLEETPPGPGDSVVTWLEAKEIQPADELSPGQTELEQGEVPDWLKELEPQQVSKAVTTDKPKGLDEELPPTPIEREEDLAKVAGGLVAAEILRSEVESTVESGEVLPESLPGVEPEIGNATPVTTSDWMEGLAPAQEGEELEAKTGEELIGASETTESLPDWLQDLKQAGESEAVPAEPAEIPEAPALSEPDLEAVPAEDIPEWMRGLEPTTQEETSITAPKIESLPEATKESDTVPAEELPEWLTSLESITEAESEPRTGQEESPGEAQFELTESPLSPQEVLPGAESPTEPSEWALENIEPEPAGEIPSPPEFEGPSEAVNINEDEAFAWLEGLAAKHGAEEALLLNPEERRETPPEWVQKEAEAEFAQTLPEAQGKPVETEALLETGNVEQVTEWIADESNAGDVPAEVPIETAAAAQEVGEPIPEEIPPVTSMPSPELGGVGLGAAIAGVTAALAGKHAEEAEIPAEAPESEMLFWPREISPAPEQAKEVVEPIHIEESPVMEEDTKPTGGKVTSEEAVLGTAIALELISQPEEPSAAIEPVGEQPETAPIFEGIPIITGQSETLPPLETLAEGEGVPDEEPSETAVEAPVVEELPEWLRGADEEMPAAASEPVELASEVGAVAPEEAAALDDEAAFAWLEGLATRQGAEDALLLNPEERTETPPEWVVEAMVAGAVVKSSEEEKEAESGEELPTWMKEISPEAETEESKPQAEEEIPAWLKQPATFEDKSAPEIQESAPLAPELPPWLADMEKPGEMEEAPGWVPSEETAVPAEPGVVQEELQAEEISVEGMPPRLDLNEAGLAELERVPGIGFVKAQAILDYRQEHGRFEKIDDLINIAGITPEEIDGLRSQIEVNAPSVEEGLEQPRDEYQVALVQARNALVQGNIPGALGYYQSLISSSQMLPEVIRDLNEALYRFPVDVEIWQSLGDAHVHSGHLQDALDAYTKAEEYLR